MVLNDRAVCRFNGGDQMKLIITLKSDLCAAVGKGYAAVVDNDTAIDELGLPYIPARRLKGCLRETAEQYMTDGDLDAIFGRTGDDRSGKLRISDAKNRNYDSLAAEIKRNNLSHEDVTNLFCRIISQTEIDDDTSSAKAESLRFTRVVECSSPIDDNNYLVFEAYITCPGYEKSENNGERSPLEVLVSRLHNIGYHRNRGLGAVKCELAEESEDETESDIKFAESVNNIADDVEYEFKYTVRLEDDLMLPGNGADRSIDYIPGTSVLGALAGKYVTSNPDFSDFEFNNLFYSRDVSFGNLYPSSESGDIAYPSPAFFGTIKAAVSDEDKGIKNIIGKSTDSGKQYKPLKKDFVDSDFNKRIAERKTVYHNALNGDSAVGLYTQYCLCSGQYYSGVITAKGEKMRKIANLMSSDKINFGRSKTAQYSFCKIVKREICDKENSQIDLKAGTTAAVVLRSDVVLVDAEGRYNAEFSVLQRAVNLAFGDICPDIVKKETAIRTHTISGYNSQWNLKKLQFPAIRAGSCIVFEIREDTTAPCVAIVGEKQNEGYGVVELIPNADKLESAKQEPFEKPECDKERTTGKLTAAVQRERNKEKLIDEAINYADKIHLKPAQVGRVTLMCRESKNLAQFIERINSIKTDSTRENAQRAFGEDEGKLKEIIISVTGVTESTSDFWDYCKLFVLTALTVKKYSLRSEGVED